MINLSNFHGTENYYLSTFRTLKLTDGVHFLRTEGSCFWLIDIIESYQNNKKVMCEEFQVWKLAIKENKGYVVCEDGNNNKIVSQDIEYTDFFDKTGLTKIDLWLTNGVLMLPSEY